MRELAALFKLWVGDEYSTNGKDETCLRSLAKRKTRIVVSEVTRGCRRELKEALRLKKRLVIVLETDPNHGGLPVDQLETSALQAVEM